MKTHCRRLAFVVLFLGFPVGVAPMTPAAALSGQSQPINDALPVTDKPVTIDVVVEDKQRHPISGLQAADFKVFDNSQPGKVIGFHAVHDDPVHILLIVDMINSAFGTVAWEREQVTEFLKQNGGHLAHPTTLGILTENGLKAYPGSTLDGNLLLTNFEKVQTSLRSVGRSAGFYGATERMEMSLTQLSQLAAYEAKLPGRKMALVISPGWPLLPLASDEADMAARTWTFGSIIAMSSQLREAHMAVYSIDPWMLGRTDPFFYQTYLKPVKVAKQADYGDLALQVLAEHSGGRAMTDGHDVLGDINEAFGDAGPYYEITLEPPTAEHPNEYHELKVSADRPDTRVLTSAGYYAHYLPVSMASAKHSK